MPPRTAPIPAPAPAAPAPAAPAPAAPEQAAYTLGDMKNHAKSKGMWAGALDPIDIPDLLGCTRAQGRPRLVPIRGAHTPALLKIWDELIVNATDHAKGQELAAPSARVTRIEIGFDPTTGRVTVFNDGPGIPVVVHPEASAQLGRKVYTPEVAFAFFLAGTNIHKPADCVRGGINGLGAKLANVHSLVFEVETVDGVARLRYSQRWRERLDITDDAVISASAGAAPHTRVSLVPAYAALGYPAAADGGLSPGNAADFDAWLCLRAHQAAAYLGPKVAVSYGGVACETTSAAALGRLLLTLEGPGDPEDDAAAEGPGAPLVLSAQAKAAGEPHRRHPWDVAVVVLPPKKKAGRRAALPNMAVVNGVLSNKGSHLKWLKAALAAAVESKLRAATKRGKAPPGGKAGEAKGKAAEADRKMGVAEALAGVRVVVCAAIPGADWGGQRKDELQMPSAALGLYSLPAAFLKRVGEAVAERILLGSGRAEKVVHDKYTRARHAGRAGQKRHTLLLAAEGDSAITLLRAGLTQSRKEAAPGGPSLDWCGIISLQGVIVNAAREVTEVETSDGGHLNVRSAKLQGNKRLLALADAFGLHYDRTYETPEELATLHYGQLLLCVDQDLDGTGKIAALVLVWVYLFWPALIRAGRVGRLMTPLVRAYPAGPAGRASGPPVEFFYEEELRAWLGEDPSRAGRHRIKYYKGLATHDAAEVARMFSPENFRRSIYTYSADATMARLFEVYFGAAPELRKAALVSPVAHLSGAEAAALRRDRLIPVGRVQLDVDSKAYKNDAIKRQIPGAIDGQNPSRRKILMGADRRFAGEASRELKVFQLGGYCADKMFYHHGDASLSATIIHLAQSFTGARRYPLLRGVGQFGSRHGDRAGSARYIGVGLSPLLKAAFPPPDRWLLPYVFEDGDRAEPQWFVPVVPLALLEGYKIVSEGWNHTSFGRDLASTLAVVDAFISGDAALLAAARLLRGGPPAPALAEVRRLSPAWPLPAELRGYSGEVRPYRGEPHSFGAYVYEAASREVVVTDLPMGLSTAKYLETLTKPGRDGRPNPRAELLEGVADRSSSDRVELRLTLREGALAGLLAGYGDADIDPIEDAFALRASLRPHLNFYSAEGGVLEFGSDEAGYLAALLYWAPFRAELYRDRLLREATVAELRLVEETEVLRYIGLAAELDLARLGDAEAASVRLAELGFPRLDSGLLHRPEYTPNSDLRRLVTGGPGAGHDYLLNLRERDLVLSAAAARRRAVAGLRADLARVSAQLAESPTPGASVWRAEIAAFCAAAGRADCVAGRARARARLSPPA